jgi:signal transduction histidine kinase
MERTHGDAAVKATVDGAALGAPDQVLAQLVSAAAHEALTHLGAIVGYGELLLGETPPDDPRRAWASIVHEHGEQLSALIEELAQLARLLTGRLELNPVAVDLGEALPRLVASLAVSAPKHALRADVAPAARWAVADSDRLQQILRRLIVTAIACSPAGGQVLVSARPDPTTGRVAVTVVDDGRAIHAAPLATPSEADDGRATRPRRNSGLELGLSIAHQLVALHGGELSAVSAPTGGNTVRFALPAAPPQPPGHGMTTALASAGRLG